MPQRSNELFVQFALSMADDPQTITSLAPAFAVLAVEAPADAAGLLRSLSKEQMAAILRNLEGSRMVALLEDESTVGDEPSAQEALDAVVFILREAEAERLSIQDDTDYVAACTRRMNQTPDESSKAAWLLRVDGWLANVSDDEVLRALSEAIDPLVTTPRLQDPGLQEVSILALGIDADVVMASGEEMTLAEARLAESVASEEVPQPVADYGAERLSVAIDEFAEHSWSFIDTLLSAAEALPVSSASFGRVSSLLVGLIGEDGSKSALDEVALDRVSTIVCRRGATKQARALIEKALRSQRLSAATVNRALVGVAPDAGLTSLIWTECAAARVRLIARTVDTSTSAKVTSSVNALAQIVGTDSLGSEIGRYTLSLSGEDPRTVLRVIRGITRSKIQASKGDLSQALLDASHRSDRALAIELIDKAISDGLVEANSDEWRDFARGIDSGSLGKLQEIVMKRARKVLRYRRSRS